MRTKSWHSSWPHSDEMGATAECATNFRSGTFLLFPRAGVTFFAAWQNALCVRLSFLLKWWRASEEKSRWAFLSTRHAKHNGALAPLDQNLAQRCCVAWSHGAPFARVLFCMLLWFWKCVEKILLCVGRPVIIIITWRPGAINKCSGKSKEWKAIWHHQFQIMHHEI